MSFQFQCPRGHLLEGDPSQAGQAVHCPTCGMLFIIPAPIVAPVAPAQPTFPTYGPATDAPPDRFANLYGEAPAVSDPSAIAASLPEPEVSAAPEPPPEAEILHIPCPNGHELETPVDMLEQDVLCPHCNVQFRLRRKDSREFKRKKEEQEKIKEIKTGSMWLNIAIVAAVLVALLVLGLIAMSIMGNTPVGGK